MRLPDAAAVAAGRVAADRAVDDVYYGAARRDANGAAVGQVGKRIRRRATAERAAGNSQTAATFRDAAAVATGGVFTDRAESDDQTAISHVNGATLKVSR